MAEYFQNEIWDTGGDGRVTITGDIYSTADPLGIFIGETPVEILSLGSAGSEINSSLNIVGSLTVNGSPVGGGSPFTELVIEKVGDDTINGIITVPTTGDFTDYLNININTASGLSIQAGTTQVYIEQEFISLYDDDGGIELLPLEGKIALFRGLLNASLEFDNINEYFEIITNGLNLNYTQLYLNGEEVTIGAPDSAGAGFRLLRIPN